MTCLIHIAPYAAAIVSAALIWAYCMGWTE